MRRRIGSGWELELLQRRMEELFDLLARPGEAHEGGWSPAIDLVELADRFVVRLDLPGVDRSDLDLRLQERELRVTGCKQAANRPDRRYHRMERGFGRFALEILLPGPVEPASCTATLARGVLEVVLPRLGERPKTVHAIPVSAEEP